MLTKKQFLDAQQRAAEMIRKAGIPITEAEIAKMDIADFGLNRLEEEGAQILTFFCTERVSVKVIALFPNQTEPEHWHTAVGSDPGKEETIRVISGTVYFYIPGEANLHSGRIPKGKEEFYTVRHEIIMKPCDQITLEPGVKHWFQAGPEGAVMYTFSSCARDALDPFTDPNIVRVTKIVD
ncbi:MAG: D-lyxose/D-mannose family sugar isomerase [Bacteroidota bacterium]